jgi:hypothetical protein
MEATLFISVKELEDKIKAEWDFLRETKLKVSGLIKPEKKNWTVEELKTIQTMYITIREEEKMLRMMEEMMRADSANISKLDADFSALKDALGSILLSQL